MGVKPGASPSVGASTGEKIAASIQDGRRRGTCAGATSGIAVQDSEAVMVSVWVTACGVGVGGGVGPGVGVGV